MMPRPKNTWKDVFGHQFLMVAVVLMIFFAERWCFGGFVAGLSGLIGGALALIIADSIHPKKTDKVAIILTGVATGVTLLAVVAAQFYLGGAFLFGLIALIPTGIVVAHILTEKTFSPFLIGLSYIGEALLIGLPIYFFAIN